MTEELDPDQSTSATTRRNSWGLACLCLLGFSTHCSPAEPFLTRFLRSQKGLSDGQLAHSVWPMYNYGVILFLLPMGLLAEALGYRPVIAFGGLMYVATYAILIFASDLKWMVATQITFSCYSVIWSNITKSYIYMVLDKASYQKGSGYMQASRYIGTVVASIGGQLLVTYVLPEGNIIDLFYISLGIGMLALAVTVVLPPPINDPPISMTRLWLEEGFKGIAAEMKTAVKDPRAMAWSLWWVYGLGSFLIIKSYYQIKFYDIDPGADFGTITAITFVFSSCLAFLPAIFDDILTKNPYCIIIGTSLLQGAALCAATTGIFAEDIMFSCGVHIVMFGMFSFQQVSASTGIARTLASPRYAVVFTCNTLIASILSASILIAGVYYNWSVDRYYYAVAVCNAILICFVAMIWLKARNRKLGASIEEEILLAPEVKPV